MAIRSQVLERFAASTGTSPMTWERYLRVLGMAGLVPKGGPGGGRASAHFAAEPLKNVTLGYVGPQPVDAARAVRALDGLWFDPSHRNNVEPSVCQPISLGDWLVQKITDLASPEEAARVTAEAPELPPLEIMMSIDPPYASMTEPLPGANYRRRHIFDRREQDLIEEPQRSAWRFTIVKLDLLLVAGELLADTLARQPIAQRHAPDPTRRTAGEGDDATPETTKAVEGGAHNGLQSETCVTHRGRKPRHATQTDPAVSRVKSSAGEGSKQLASGLAVCGSQAVHQPARTGARDGRTQRTGATST